MKIRDALRESKQHSATLETNNHKFYTVDGNRLGWFVSYGLIGERAKDTIRCSTLDEALSILPSGYARALNWKPNN